MRGRITWENVVAPDFSDAIQARQLGAGLISGGLDSLSGAFGDAARRGRTQASTKAMDAAMQIQDVAAWDELMATQGMKGLGINADQATPELLQFLQGYREDLSTDRGDDLAHTTSQYNLDRSRVLAGREDIAHERQEEERNRNLKGLGLADEQGNKATSAAEAKQNIRALNLSPEEEKAALAAVDQMDPIHFTASEEFAGTTAATPEYRKAMEQLTLNERELERNYANKDQLRLYETSTKAYGDYTNMASGIADRLRDNIEGDEHTFSETRGKIEKLFNKLEGKYEELPDEVIAMALENNLTRTGMISRSWNGGDETFDTSAIEADLGDIQRNLTGLDNLLIQRDREMGTVAAQRQELERLAEKRDLLLSRDTKTSRAQAAEVDAELAGLLQQLSPTEDPAALAAAAAAQAAQAGKGVPGSATPNPAERVLAEAAGETTPPLPVDPRIQGGRDVLGELGRKMGHNAWGPAQAIDGAVGDAWALTSRAGNALMGAGAMGVGMFAPETGTSMLNWVDQQNANVDRIAEQGFIPDGPNPFPAPQRTPAPAPAAAPANQGVIQEAAKDPEQTLTAIFEQTDIPAARKEDAIAALRELKRGDISADDRRSIMQDLRYALGLVEESAMRTGMSANDPILALIKNPDAWLGQ